MKLIIKQFPLMRNSMVTLHGCFVEAGARPNVRASDGLTALDRAHRGHPLAHNPNYPRIIEILVAAGDEKNALHLKDISIKISLNLQLTALNICKAFHLLFLHSTQISLAVLLAISTYTCYRSHTIYATKQLDKPLNK